jgi:hypothetical protein
MQSPSNELPGWPTTTWELPAPESYVLLHAVDRPDTEPFKLAVPLAFIGRVSADGRFRLGPIDLPLSEMRDAYEGGLERALAGP